MARRRVGHLRHARHAPVGLRLGAHRVLHAVQRGVQVMPMREEGRQLRVVRAAPQRHHHGLRHLRGQRLAADFADAVQHQVDPGRHAGAAADRRVEHEDAVGDHLAIGRRRAQFVEVVVVRGHAVPGQQARMRREQGAGADGDQFQPAGLQPLPAEPVQQRARLVGVDRDGAAGQPDQDDPRWPAPCFRQGRQPAQRHANRADAARRGRHEVDDEALGLLAGAQQLVGDAQRLRRAGPVEHQAVRQQGEGDADRWAGDHRWSWVALNAQRAACRPGVAASRHARPDRRDGASLCPAPGVAARNCRGCSSPAPGESAEAPDHLRNWGRPAAARCRRSVRKRCIRSCRCARRPTRAAGRWRSVRRQGGVRACVCAFKQPAMRQRVPGLASRCTGWRSGPAARWRCGP